MFYQRFEDKRPVMVLELPSQKIYAYPYKEFKDDLNERSQAMLKDQYERAVAEDKIVVFVRDNESRRFVSMTFDNERAASEVLRPGCGQVIARHPDPPTEP
jgi:hypothetical protein